MDYKFLILCLTSSYFTFAKFQLLKFLNPVKHGKRIVNYEYSCNKSIFNWCNYEVKTLNTIQLINVNASVRLPMSPNTVEIELIKCKEYFYDCANLRSFELKNFCTHLDEVLFFLSIGYKDREIICPFEGQYVYKNISISTKAYPMFFAVGEKFWDHSYILIVNVYDENKSKMTYIKEQINFLTFRSRKNQ